MRMQQTLSQGRIAARKAIPPNCLPSAPRSGGGHGLCPTTSAKATRTSQATASGSGIARAKGAEPGDSSDEPKCRARGGNRAVQKKIVRRRRLLRIAANRDVRNAWNALELALVDRKPCRHGVAAAGFEQPLFVRRADKCSKIDAGDRTRRAASHAAFEAHDEGRFAEAIFQSACDDADDAGMPAFARRENERRIVLRRRIGDRFFEDDGFQRLPLAIVLGRASWRAAWHRHRSPL